MTCAGEAIGDGRKARGAARWVDRTCVGLAFLCLLAFSLHRIVALDLWWQLTTGEWILENGFPRVDPFSYGFPGRDWIELRWLYYIGAHWIADAWGLNGLIVAKCAVLLGAFAVMAAVFSARERWVTAIGLAMVLVLIYPRLRLRPEVMSFLWIGVIFLCHERYKQTGARGWLWALPIVGVVWSNTHTLWVLGPVLLWTSVACEWLSLRLGARFPLLAGDRQPMDADRIRALAWAAGGVSVAGLATPYGTDGFLYPLTLISQIRVGGELALLIYELRSPLLDARFDFLFLAYLAVLWLSACSFYLRIDRLVLTRVAWWAGFLLLSLMSVRNLSLFGVVAAAVTTANLRDWLHDDGVAEAEGPGARPPSRLARWLPNASRGALLILLIALPPSIVTDHFWRTQNYPHRFGFGTVEQRVPMRAMAFVREQGLPTPVMGTLGDGGYLLRIGGDRSVYVDGRLEVYGEENLSYAIRTQQDPDGYLALLDEYEIDTAVASIRFLREPVLAMEARPDWVSVYFDDAYVVFVRLTDSTRDLIARWAIDWRRPTSHPVAPPAFDSPPDWLEGIFPRVPDVDGLLELGELLTAMRSLRAARDTYAEAVRLRPDHGHSRLMLGLLSEVLGWPESGERLLATLPPQRLTRSDVRNTRSHFAQVRTSQCQQDVSRWDAGWSEPRADVTDLFDLGACLERLGRTGDARAVWEATLAVAPDHTGAQLGLLRLAGRPTHGSPR